MLVQCISGILSACTVSERPWVRVPVGPHSFSAPVTFGGSVWVFARAASSQMGLSRRLRHGSEQIRGRI